MAESPGAHDSSPELARLSSGVRDKSADLARLREDLCATANRESDAILVTAAADVRDRLLRARRDLIVLRGQVQATIGVIDAAAASSADAPAESARELLLSDGSSAASALREACQEIEILAAETTTLRAAPIPLDGIQKPDNAAAPAGDWPEPPHDSPAEEAWTSAALPPEPDLTRVSGRRFRLRPVLLAAIGLAAVAGAFLWISRTPVPDEAAQPPVPAAVTIPAPAPAQPVPTETSAAAPAALSLRIETRRPVWMRVTADGRVTSERLFAAGETQDVTADDEVSIRAGDAGAVFVSVNGGDPIPLGADGVVLTRRFAATDE